MKRLLALVAGGLGLRAILRRRSRPAVSPSPAEDLRAKLAETKAQEPEVRDEPEPVQPETVEGRRADVHAKARQAIDDLGDGG
jgi:flagellar biosynthesis/type III secretory pathway M-ring protein FliF/YscJ